MPAAASSVIAADGRLKSVSRLAWAGFERPMSESQSPIAASEGTAEVGRDLGELLEAALDGRVGS